jgi:hypothetical protein
MHYLYLDESGDLGHHLQSAGASRHFMITVLEVTSDKDKKAIEKAVLRTLRYKLKRKKSHKVAHISELKGTLTDFLSD